MSLKEIIHEILNTVLNNTEGSPPTQGSPL